MSKVFSREVLRSDDYAKLRSKGIILVNFVLCLIIHFHSRGLTELDICADRASILTPLGLCYVATKKGRFAVQQRPKHPCDIGIVKAIYLFLL